MIAFLFSPMGWRIALALAAMIALFGAFYVIEKRGEERARAKIEAANAKAQSKADAAERDVMSCPPGKWNRESGKCVR